MSEKDRATVERINEALMGLSPTGKDRIVDFVDGFRKGVQQERSGAQGRITSLNKAGSSISDTGSAA